MIRAWWSARQERLMIKREQAWVRWARKRQAKAR